MVDFREREEESLRGLDMDAIRRKRDELRAMRTGQEQDLDALMAQEEKRAQEQYYGTLHGVDRVVAQFKEFIGRGAEYDYQQLLKTMGATSSQLESITKNALESANEFGTKILEYSKRLEDDKLLLKCNYDLYLELQRQLTEAKSELDEKRGKSVLPQANSETFDIQHRIYEIERDMNQIDFENNSLLVQMGSCEAELAMQQDTYESLQSLYSQVDEQRSSFDSRYQIELAQQRITKDLAGVSSVKAAYMRAAILAQDLDQVKERTQRKPLDELPSAFTLFKPEVKHRQRGKAAWLQQAQRYLS